jgi:CO/xanthine dehydrogenase Mo-binding subunit/CO/xanthine dehydrogenase FAD-binding subunit
VSSIGRSVPLIDWDERTSGATTYTADLIPEDALVAGVVRSPHAFARIKHLDVRPALSVSGVKAAITANDFRPGARYYHRGGELADRPPLADGVVRYVGQEVAVVAAESARSLSDGLRRVRVVYAPTTAPLTIDAALSPSSRRLHERASGEQNVSVEMSARWGRRSGGRPSDVTTARTYSYPAINHMAMEPSITIARWDPERELLELWTPTQAPWFISWEVAGLLGLDQSQVVCREVGVGGGFGLRSKIGEHEVLVAMLARMTQRPVALRYTRTLEFGAAKRRHAARVSMSLSGARHGRFESVEADIALDNGGYNHMGPSVLAAAAEYVGSIYTPEEVVIRARLVDTATSPGGPFRGYGAPQVSFALESEIDEWARAAGVDPLQARIRNANPPFSTALNGSRYRTVALAECLEHVGHVIGWEGHSKLPRGRGVGVAGVAHGSGAFAYPRANESEATIDCDTAGVVTVRFAGADAGTGQRTVLAQIAASVLGIAPEHVVVRSMDASRAPFDLGAWSSRATHLSGGAVKDAAEQLAELLRSCARRHLGASDPELIGGTVVCDGRSLSFGELVKVETAQGDGRLEAHGHYASVGVEPFGADENPHNSYGNYAFGAHAAEVAVDERTGEIRVLRYVTAHDVGRALNPVLVESQIVGATAMGLGAALGEEIIRADGKVANGSLLDYACPRARDVPEIEVALIGEPDPETPFGLKSAGELGIVPPGAVIGNAVYDACGIRIAALPATPDRVLEAIAARDGRTRRITIGSRPGRWWIALIRWAYPRGLHTVLHRFGTRFARRVAEREIEELAEPTTASDAATAMADGATAIGGGTDLLVQRSEGLIAPRKLVSVMQIDELRGVTEQDDGLVIGGAVTLSDLIDDERVPQVMRDAARTIASPQVRAAATVAGNLLQAKRCWYFRGGFDCYKRGGPTCPCYAVLGDHRFFHAAIGAHRCQAVTPSDLATVLVALDAEILVAGSTPRAVPAAQLYNGPGESVLSRGDLVRGVRVPRAGRRGRFKKLSLYDGGFAMASVALTTASECGGAFRDVRLVVGGIAPTPWRARTTEAALEGQWPDASQLRSLLDDELNRQAHPLPQNGWKLDAGAGLAERALEELLEL